jgi:hypothetical protein
VSFATRLARLEKAAALERAISDEAGERQTKERAWMEAAWGLMQRSMSQEHIRLVAEAHAAGAQFVQSPEHNTPAGRLLRQCLDAISRLKYRRWPYKEIAPAAVLAMPLEVAQVYLEHDALPLHDCEDCGFRVPITPGGYKGRPAQIHFRSCPLCGGKVGWNAYYNRRMSGAAAS